MNTVSPVFELALVLTQPDTSMTNCVGLALTTNAFATPKSLDSAVALMMTWLVVMSFGYLPVNFTSTKALLSPPLATAAVVPLPPKLKTDWLEILALAKATAAPLLLALLGLGPLLAVTVPDFHIATTMTNAAATVITFRMTCSPFWFARVQLNFRVWVQ
jgi:hypothetical protein